jgi:hypothetical protein
VDRSNCVPADLISTPRQLRNGRRTVQTSNKGFEVFKEICIGPTEQLFIAGAADITAADSQPLDDVRNDVFVCEVGEIERLHAVILNSHVCSPLSASAAYRNAAARPSGLS